MPNFTGRRPPEIDVRIPGLDHPRTGDRFKVSAETRNPTLYRARKQLIRELGGRMLFVPEVRAVLHARLDGKITTAALQAAAVQGDAALAALVEGQRTRRLTALLDEFLHGHPAKRAFETRMQIERFIASVNAEHPEWVTTADFTAAQIDLFLGNLTKQGRGRGEPASGPTRNRYRAALYGFATWMLGQGHITQHPLVGRQVRRWKEGARRLPSLDAEEQERLVTLAGEHAFPGEGEVIELFFRTLIATGADVDEAWHGLRVRDVLPGTPTTLPRVRLKRPKVDASPERLVPVTRTYAAHLTAYIAERQLQPADLVFAAIESDWHLRRPFELAREAVGLPDLTRKDLRHVAAINWRRAGADLQQVQEWLGHTDISETTIYQAFGPDDEHDTPVINRLEERLDVSKVVPIRREA